MVKTTIESYGYHESIANEVLLYEPTKNAKDLYNVPVRKKKKNIIAAVRQAHLLPQCDVVSWNRLS